MQQNDQNDLQNVPSETTRSTMLPILIRGYLKFAIHACVEAFNDAFHALWIELQFAHAYLYMHYSAVLWGL